MAETSKKPSSNRSAKERRNTFFRVLDGVLSLSHKKFITLETSEKLTTYTGWFIKFIAGIDKRILEKEIKELRKNRRKISKKQTN